MVSIIETILCLLIFNIESELYMKSIILSVLVDWYERLPQGK